MLAGVLYDLYKQYQLRKEMETVPVSGVYKGFYKDETNGTADVSVTLHLKFTADCNQEMWTVSGHGWDSTIGSYNIITGELQQSGKTKWQTDCGLVKDGWFVFKQNSFINGNCGLLLELHRDQYSSEHQGVKKIGFGPAYYNPIW